MWAESVGAGLHMPAALKTIAAIQQPPFVLSIMHRDDTPSFLPAFNTNQTMAVACYACLALQAFCNL